MFENYFLQVYMVHKKLKNSDIPRKGFIPNRKYKIFFEDSQIQKKFEKLNEHRCSKCNLSERNLKALQQHLSKTHTLFFCALCLEHLKVKFCVFCVHYYFFKCFF